MNLVIWQSKYRYYLQNHYLLHIYNQAPSGQVILGPAMRAELIELVRELVQEQRMAALLVSHQPADALLASARCAFVCDGRIAACAATAELLAADQPAQLREYLGSR